MDNQASHEPPIAVFDELPSTNDYLKENPALWSVNYHTVCARLQAGGRGRNGRKWLMQADRDLAFTMVFHFDGGLKEASGLTPFIGYSLRQILSQLLAESGNGELKPLQLKWPNDILAGGKKICGILCELVQTGAPHAVLIGVGININSDASLNDPQAVSLKELSGQEFPLEATRQKIIFSLATALKSLQFPYSTGFCREWYENCMHPNARIAWTGEGGARYEGVIAGIDDHGCLIVQDAAQRAHIVSQDIEWLQAR